MNVNLFAPIHCKKKFFRKFFAFRWGGSPFGCGPLAVLCCFLQIYEMLMRVKMKEHRQTEIETKKFTGAVKMLTQGHTIKSKGKCAQWLRKFGTPGSIVL